MTTQQALPDEGTQRIAIGSERVPISYRRDRNSKQFVIWIEITVGVADSNITAPPVENVEMVTPFLLEQQYMILLALPEVRQAITDSIYNQLVSRLFELDWISQHS